MGSYLNPGKSSFEMALNSQIFVDKSGMIDRTNRLIKTMQRFICVSRPRRFGKSMALDMLAAYYGRETDSSSLFDDLQISKKESYLKNLDQYDVIKINIQEFLSATHTVDDMIKMISRYLIFDLTEQFHEVRYRDENNLVQVMKDIFSQTGRSFATRDNVLTLLIHLGYLTYNSERHMASISNREVSQECMNAISTMNWHDVISSVNDSRKLLEAMWNIEKITK